MYRHPGKVCAYWDQLIYHHDLCEVRGTEQSLVLIRKPCWSRKELGIITAGRRVEVARHSREKGQGHAPRQGEGSKSHATAEGRVKVTRHSRGKGHSRTPQQGEGSRSRSRAEGRVKVTCHSRGKGQGRAPQQGEGPRSQGTVGGRVEVTRHSEGAVTDTPQVFTNSNRATTYAAATVTKSNLALLAA